MRWALTCASLLAGCYLSHERPIAGDRSGSRDAAPSMDGPPADAATAPDAGFPADARDVDTGPCRTFDMTWGTACTAEIDAECERRASIAAAGRYSYSQCVTLETSRQSSCSAGDLCTEGRCRCTATRECTPVLEVCVSDTPDGPHYCARACRAPDSARAWVAVLCPVVVGRRRDAAARIEGRG